jgi:hypothetical protein
LSLNPEAIGQDTLKLKLKNYLSRVNKIRALKNSVITLLILLAGLTPTLLRAQPTLSDDATISVITCGPGQDELYAAFGHSAMRVQDPVNNIDQVYNWGVFDFKQKNFYLNFARGKNFYRLASYSFRDFQYAYIYYNRYIHQQKLNLTPEQTRKLFNYLQWNNRPENQKYRYDYFYDNCATRIRDVVKAVFGDSVVFNDSHITTDYTIRDLTDIYLQWQPWGDLGIDICLGLPMDKHASPYEYMFLPDYIEAGFANATIIGDSSARQLVGKSVSLYQPSDEEELSNGIFQPLYVFTAVFVVSALVSLRDYRRKKLTNAFDVTLFSVTGSIGLLLLLLWVATDHKAAAYNFNLLWALPTHLVAAIAFIRQPRWLKSYFGITMVLQLLLLLSWALIPQDMHEALIPFVMTIALRAGLQYFMRPAA